jgi:hypothetical protein
VVEALPVVREDRWDSQVLAQLKEEEASVDQADPTTRVNNRQIQWGSMIPT